MPGTIQARSEQCGVEGVHGVLWMEAGTLFPSGQLKLLLQDAVLAPEALPSGHTHLSSCHPTRPSVVVHVRLCGTQPPGLDCVSFISVLPIYRQQEKPSKVLTEGHVIRLVFRRMTQLRYGESIRASRAREVERVGVLERNNEWLQRAAEAGEAGREQARLLSRPWFCSSRFF